ncbi:uncharacterized protein PV09_09093 [Verruconis gallopava]|uniref:Beta-xylosidase C-terminal Concanavalin A-like domain-containing protein n=1 Tax=Verruconis gallopava TaxID=253628 RepID=A0A0D1ZYR4_9PEZI|nr:uncharacterized protein PV09_09093 [Verruconis gallopava]KIV99229.1 hypothetical protein PV09_09093 [Verruconis gallopava]
MTITNPIIPGFAPDPSIVLVKDTYYLVNSSFHVFPGLPIYTSNNLQDWTLRTHAISRPTQLSLRHAWATQIPVAQTPNLIINGGLFAPTIRYYRSMFYIVCTNAIEDPDEKKHIFENFLISCPEERICDPYAWSDPIYFAFPGIDPSLFFDTKTGRAFIQGSYRSGPPWAPNCSIRQFEIDLNSGKALSETRLLWKGARPGGDAEGPHLYHKDGWYYLLTAEGSTFEGHEINIARARDIWGPYESCPSNPLLTAKGTKEAVQWTGHGDLFQDKNGKWWCVHLGVRQNGTNVLRCPLGRETFLTPVTWEHESWPKINQTRLEFDEPVEFMAEISSKEQKNLGDALICEDTYIRTPDLTCYRHFPPNSYELSPRSSTLNEQYGSTTFVGRRQRSLECSVTVELNVRLMPTNGVHAGLAVYKDNLRHAEIFYNSHKKRMEFGVVSTIGVSGEITGHGSISDVEGSVLLKIDARPCEYTFSWARKVSESTSFNWSQIASIDSAILSGHDMTGTFFGMFANTVGDFASTAQWVRFEDFRMVNK